VTGFSFQGTGNANFYFATGLAYTCLQVTKYSYHTFSPFCDNTYHSTTGSFSCKQFSFFLEKNCTILSRNLGFCFGANCCEHIHPFLLMVLASSCLCCCPKAGFENSILKVNFKIQCGNLCTAIKHRHLYIFFFSYGHVYRSCGA